MIENLRISDRIYHTLKVQIFVAVLPLERPQRQITISDEASESDKPDCSGAPCQHHKLDHKEYHHPVAAVADSIINQEAEKRGTRHCCYSHQRRSELHKDNCYQVANQSGEQDKLHSVHHPARPCPVGLGIHSNGIHSSRCVGFVALILTLIQQPRWGF